MSDPQEKKMPTSLKWVIGIVAFVFIVTALFACLGAVFIKNTIDKTPDPVNVERIADSVADFAKPLPAGFKIETATEMLTIKTLVITHHPERMMISWTVAAVKDGDPMGKGFESGFEAGLKSAGVNSFEQTGEGKLPVGHTTLQYKVGQQVYSSGKYPVLKGRISGVPEKLISIIAYSDPGEPFNMELFKKFLDGVQDVSP